MQNLLKRYVGISLAHLNPFQLTLNQKARKMEQEITKLSDELNWALSSAERDELMNNKGRS
jgi:hypothetical protein